MFLTGTVGFRGTNHPSDAKLVQTLFNLNRSRFADVTPRRLAVDGLVGEKTVAALERFQRDVMGIVRTHPLVADHDATMQALVSNQDASFSKDKLIAVMPHASSELVDRLYRPESDRFETAPPLDALTSPQFDAGTRQVTAFERASASQYLTRTYEFAGDELVLVRESRQSYSEPGRYRLTVTERRDGRMQVVDERQVDEN